MVVRVGGNSPQTGFNKRVIIVPRTGGLGWGWPQVQR